MKHFDLILVGNSPTAAMIAQRYSKRAVAIVSLPQSPETLFYRHIAALNNQRTPHVDESPLPGVAYFSGTCEFTNPHEIRINEETLWAKHVVLMSGARYLQPALPGLDRIPWQTPLEALTSESPNTSAIVIGAGPSAVAVAQQIRPEGHPLTLLASTPRILPKEDPDVSAFFHDELTKSGVRLHTQATVDRVESTGNEIQANFSIDGQRHAAVGSKIVVAVGFSPNSDHFGLDRAGVYVRKDGTVAVNDEMRTSAPHVWATGLLTGMSHRISLEWAQAEIVAKNIAAPFFDKARVLPESLPMTLGTRPSFARVGLTEPEARARYSDTHCVRLCLNGSSTNECCANECSRPMGWEPSSGFIKLVGRKRSNELLGAHICAPHAHEMILYFDLMLQAGHTVDDVFNRAHFPGFTFGEAIYSALEKWLA